jgi:hypothetical protein
MQCRYPTSAGEGPSAVLSFGAGGKSYGPGDRAGEGRHGFSAPPSGPREALPRAFSRRGVTGDPPQAQREARVVRALQGTGLGRLKDARPETWSQARPLAQADPWDGSKHRSLVTRRDEGPAREPSCVEQPTWGAFEQNSVAQEVAVGTERRVRGRFYPAWASRVLTR